MPGQATPCSSIEVVITSTTGNRVAVKSGPRVRISPAAPEKERHPKRGASSFSAQEEIRIKNRQPPGAAGSSGPVRTIPLYPPLRRICKRISSCCASSPGAAGSSGPARTTRRRGRHIVRGDFFCKSHLSLILSRLLPKSNPLRWASIWFWARLPITGTAPLFFIVPARLSFSPAFVRTAASYTPRQSRAIS